MTSRASKDWNRFYRAMWQHCRAKPHAVEDHPWGEEDTVFKVGGKKGNIFAFLGHPKTQEAGVTVKPSREELGGFLGLPYVTRAPYIGRYGWIHVSVRNQRTLKMALDLIDDTYAAIIHRSTKRTRVPT